MFGGPTGQGPLPFFSRRSTEVPGGEIRLIVEDAELVSLVPVRPLGSNSGACNRELLMIEAKGPP